MNNYNIKNFNSLSVESKYPILVLFYEKLNKFNSLKPRKCCTKEKKMTVYGNVSKIYNDYVETYFDENKALPDATK